MKREDYITELNKINAKLNLGRESIYDNDLHTAYKDLMLGWFKLYKLTLTLKKDLGIK